MNNEKSAPVPPANGLTVPLADHDEIGRKVFNQPWEIQSAIVAITAHCTALTDKHPTGEVADIVGCISQCCSQLADALASGAVAAEPDDDWGARSERSYIDNTKAARRASWSMREVLMLIDEFDPKNSDWSFHKGLLKEALDRLATPTVRGDRETYAELARNYWRTSDSKPIRKDYECLIGGKIADAILSLPVQPGAGEREATYQARVDDWLMACFGKDIARDRIERNHRFIEEALETIQANGCTASEAHQLVDYVYGRPIGDLRQEVGGVMNTLAALCLASGVDLDEAAEAELARVWTMVEKIRTKQAAKPKHSPLPELSRQAPHSSGEGGR